MAAFREKRDANFTGDVTDPRPRIQRVAAYNVCLDDAGRLLLCRLSDITERPGSWTLPAAASTSANTPKPARSAS